MSSVSFYTGRVSHQRFGDIQHRLSYKIAYVLVDLDRIDEANAQSNLLGIGRKGVMSVRAQDHGDGKSQDLAAWVRGFLSEKNIHESADRIELLTLPRMFGFVFNPVSVYFIFDKANTLHHVLYEVNNTFGARHFYLCPANGKKTKRNQSSRKEFFVSPFFDVEGHYRFSVRPPGDNVALTIRYDSDDQKKAMTAHLFAVRRLVSRWGCLRILAGFPFMTLGVVVGIHWEALKLLMKGARYRPYAGHSNKAGVTFGDTTQVHALASEIQKAAA